MRTGVHLRKACSIALSVQPDLVIAHDLAERFQVFDGLLRAKVGQPRRMAGLGWTLICKCARLLRQGCFLGWCACGPMRLVELARRQYALHLS